MTPVLIFVMDELSGKEHGPYTLDEIQTMVYQKKLKKQHLVRKSDYGKWFKAQDLLGKVFVAVEEKKAEEKKRALEERRLMKEASERARSPQQNQPPQLNRPPQQNQPPQLNRPPQQKKCSACFKNIDQRATRCPHCTEPQGNANRQAPNRGGNLKTCRDCGTGISRDAVKCPACGCQIKDGWDTAFFGGGKAAWDNDPNKPDIDWNKRITAGLVAGCVIGPVIAIIMMVFISIFFSIVRGIIGI